MELAAKVDRLRSIVSELGSAAVAFSGGVDSGLVLKVCADVLGIAPERLIAVTADSESYAREELARARELARALGVEHAVVQTREIEREEYRENTPGRCYFCKVELYGVLLDLARRRGLRHVVDGFNASDVGDHRPGARAGIELGVRSPLREAGFTKEDIRRHARELGLPIWDKPAMACLSSRVPYGTQVTPEVLRQVEAAEAAVRRLGYRQFRVRHHDRLARLELAPEDIPRAIGPDREGLVRGLKEAGYAWVTIDLEGYRSGSLLEAVWDAGRQLQG